MNRYCPLVTRHLELQIHITGPCHKLGVGRSPKQGVIWTLDFHHPIIWSREDHPPQVDNPGQLALVVAPRVGGYKFAKVLMDGGSSINILYYETFQRMGLTDNGFFREVISVGSTLFC